jgi:hypothetical protein
MLAVAWFTAVWLLTLTLFVTLMASRRRIEHPRPPIEQETSQQQAGWSSAA